jgi:hypothetical protein
VSLDNADKVIEGGPGFDVAGITTEWVPRSFAFFAKGRELEMLAQVLLMMPRQRKQLAKQISTPQCDIQPCLRNRNCAIIAEAATTAEKKE